MKNRLWMGMALGWVLTGAGGAAGCRPEETQTESQVRAADGHIWPPFPEEATGMGGQRGENPWLDGSLGPPMTGDGANQAGGDGMDRSGPTQGTHPATAFGGDTGQPTEPGQDTPLQEDPVLLQRRFTIYAEGLGSDKRLLIWGEAGTSPLDCRIDIYTNGSLEPRRKLSLPSTFAESNVVAFCSPTAWSEGCTHEMSGSLYNGNDALVLRCGDVVLDSLGTLGEDPGDGWIRDGQEGRVSTQNQVLVRCGEELDPDPFDATTLLDWSVQGADESLEESLSRCPSTKAKMGGASSSTHS